MNISLSKTGRKQSDAERRMRSVNRKQYIALNKPNGLFQKDMIPWNKGLKGFMAGEKNGNWKGKVDLICQVCGANYQVHQCHKNRSKYCSHKCSSVGKIGHKEDPNITKMRTIKTSGENHYNFKGWKSREPYGKDWSKSLKRMIRDRDGHKCQSCGVPEIECLSLLTVHHINEIKTDLRSENLISLCKSCHGKVHFKKYTAQKQN